jgi:hypothetical protein
MVAPPVEKPVEVLMNAAPACPIVSQNEGHKEAG